MWEGKARLGRGGRGGAGAIYDNTGSSTAWGSEMSLNYLGRPWLVQSNVTWVRSENTDEDIEYIAFPKVMLNIGIGYQLRNNQTRIYLFQHVQLDQHEADYLSTAAGWVEPEPAPDFWRIDLNVQHQFNSQLVLFGTVRNMTDRDNVKPSLYNASEGIREEELSVSAGFNWSL